MNVINVRREIIYRKKMRMIKMVIVSRVTKAVFLVTKHAN